MAHARIHHIAHRVRPSPTEGADRDRGARILCARWGVGRRLHDAFTSNAPMPLAPRPVPPNLLEAVPLAS